MNQILYLTPITMDCLHISAKTNRKFTCKTPLTANRTPNRTAIRTQNHACRRPHIRQFNRYPNVTTNGQPDVV
jgi:hypothetical protein